MVPTLLRQPRSYMAGHQGDCPLAINVILTAN